MKIAAIDQGTTSTRVLVAEAGGPAKVAHSLRHAQSFPRDGWVEHDPDELVGNIRAVLEAAGPVDAIGIDNQGESCLAWDARTRRPLSPVIVWQDRRTAATLDALGPDERRLSIERSGLPLDPYFSGSKLGWLLAANDEVKAARRAGTLRLGTTDAFFLDMLAGTFATDPTTASRTGLMDLRSLAWDPDLCRLHGVPPECLPEIRPTVGSFGEHAGTPILASVVDQQAALYGHGCRRAGDAKVTFGTGAFALVVTGDRLVEAPDRGILPTVAWQHGQDRVRAAEGGVYDAGAAVEWAMRLGIVADLAELDAFEAAPAIDRDLVFVPALSGLACPHWDRSAAALWLGMGQATTRLDLAQALLEGIALRTAEVLAALDAEVPVAATVSVDGGLSRSRYFCQFLADATGRRILTRTLDELTAVGTAELAAVGLGRTLDIPLGDGRAYEPRREGGPLLARFAEALSRSRSWRAG